MPSIARSRGVSSVLDDEGRDVWRLEYTNPEDDESIVLEGLFAPRRGELIRLRSKFPGEEEQELPVERETYTYADPVQLTDESVDGAAVGTARVAVPAGSFEACHIQYGTAAVDGRFPIITRAGTDASWTYVDGTPGPNAGLVG